MIRRFASVVKGFQAFENLELFAAHPAGQDTLKKLRILIRHAIDIGRLKHDSSLRISGRRGRNVSLLVASAVNAEGFRREDKSGWSAFPRYLVDRGLKCVPAAAG
jgi:hypothetical protein